MELENFFDHVELENFFDQENFFKCILKSNDFKIHLIILNALQCKKKKSYPFNCLMFNLNI